MTTTTSPASIARQTTSRLWLAHRRAAAPRLRRPQPVGLVVNGSNRAILGCALCGATHSFARTARLPGYGLVSVPEPRHAQDFRAAHNSLEHLLAHLPAQAAGLESMAQEVLQ